MRYNNRDDLLQLSFTLKISIFSEVFDGAFIVKIVSRLEYSLKSSIIDACLGSKYASAF